MKKQIMFCDECKKEIPSDEIYYTAGVKLNEVNKAGFITKPLPNNVEVCSKECAIKWLNQIK